VFEPGWVLVILHHTTIWWLSIQLFIFLLLFCLETPKVGSGPSNWRTVVSLASPSAVSFQRTPVCPWTQNSPTECWMETSFIAFWHCCTNGDMFRQPEELPKPPDYHNKYIFLWSSVHLNFVSTGQDNIGLYIVPENCSLFS